MRGQLAALRPQHPQPGAGHRRHARARACSSTTSRTGSPRSKLNIESAEYANIVASVVRFYDSAIARGMRPLPAADEALLRRWMTRVLAGYWTHGGYLNWDTGFSFGRWHQMKKFALSQQALIGIAAGGRLSPSRAEASWAKYILETGFELYERKLPEGDGRRARACSIR